MSEALSVLKVKDGNGNWIGIPGLKGDNATPEQVSEATDSWLEENISQETGYVLDRSLTMPNAAAPADLVGELKDDRPYVYVEEFGAVGDGETDDAEAIQAAVDYCILNNKKLMFHAKTYGVVPYQTYTEAYSNQIELAIVINGSVEIDLNGCTIQLLENAFERLNVIEIVDAENPSWEQWLSIRQKPTTSLRPMRVAP